MKRILIVLVAVLLATVFLTLGVSAESEHTDEGVYTITEPYEYPILPGDEGWDDLSPAERHAAVQIDPSILDSMTTEALMETTFTNPLIGLMYAYDTLEQGVENARKSCQSLDILMNRTDLMEKLLVYRNDETHGIKTTCAKRLLVYLNPNESSVVSYVPVKKNEIISPCYLVDPVTGWQVEYLYTPRNSRVRSYFNLSFSDLNTSFADAEQLGDDLASFYGATKCGTANASYNCHSYAWYSTSPYNRYWINDPTPYINDGSYILGPCVTGAKILYRCKEAGAYYGLVTHSAICCDLSRAISKWGCLGVYEHNITFCPYSDDNSSSPLDHSVQTFWHLNYN